MDTNKNQREQTADERRFTRIGLASITPPLQLPVLDCWMAVICGSFLFSAFIRVHSCPFAVLFFSSRLRFGGAT